MGKKCQNSIYFREIAIKFLKTFFSKIPSDITGVFIFWTYNNNKNNDTTGVTLVLALGANPYIGHFGRPSWIFGGHIGKIIKKFFFLNFQLFGLSVCQISKSYNQNLIFLPLTPVSPLKSYHQLWIILVSNTSDLGRVFFPVHLYCYET